MTSNTSPTPSTARVPDFEDWWIALPSEAMYRKDGHRITDEAMARLGWNAAVVRIAGHNVELRAQLADMQGRLDKAEFCHEEKSRYANELSQSLYAARHEIDDLRTENAALADRLKEGGRVIGWRMVDGVRVFDVQMYSGGTNEFVRRDDHDTLRAAARKLAEAMDMQLKRQSGEFHITAKTAAHIWNEALAAYRDAAIAAGAQSCAAIDSQQEPKT